MRGRRARKVRRKRFAHTPWNAVLPLLEAADYFSVGSELGTNTDTPSLPTDAGESQSSSLAPLDGLVGLAREDRTHDFEKNIIK